MYMYIYIYIYIYIYSVDADSADHRTGPQGTLAGIIV